MAVADSLMMQIGQIAKDAGCPNDEAPLAFSRERMQAETELKTEAAALIAEVKAGSIRVDGNEPSVSDLASKAISHWLSARDKPLAIERLPRVRDDDFEWKVPFRGGHLFMPVGVHRLQDGGRGPQDR